jgi:hypothetical protein
MNPESLALLREKGVLLGSTILITNAFYANNETIADSLATCLTGHGFRAIEQTIASSEADSGKLYVEANIDVVLGLSTLNEMTDLCVDIAEHCHAEYDGWFTEVQPPDQK